MFMNRYVLVLLLLSSCKIAFAQIKSAGLINITKQDGLPSNETYCLFKDSKNYIWIATDQGVVRHKGSSMQVINNLPDNVVFKIREDNKGRVWFFSHTGKLAYFFGNKLYPFIYNDSIVKYIKQVLINDARVTDDGEIILASLRDGCSFTIKKNGAVVKNCTNNTDEHSSTYLVHINTWMGNRLFMQLQNPVATSGFSAIKIVLTHYEKPVAYILANTAKMLGQFGAIKTRDNEVFCWFDNYIVKLNRDGSLLLKELPQKVLVAFSDTINNTIIAGLAKGGVTVLNTQLDIVEHDDINKYSVSSVETDNEGEIWFSTLENGVYYTKNSNWQKQFVKKIHTAPAQRMAAIADSFIVFANAEGIFKLDGNTVSGVFKESNTAVGDIMPGKQKSIYYARVSPTLDTFSNHKSADAAISNIVAFSTSNEIVKFDNDFLSVNRYFDFILLPAPQQSRINKNSVVKTLDLHGITVSTATAKDNNTILFGTKNSLIISDISSGNFRPFYDSTNLFSKGVTVIRKMNNGIFAIGVRFGGLAIVQDTMLIGNITEADGLLSNSIKYILPMGNRLWLATPNGISVVQFSSYHPLRYSIKNLGEEAGFNNMLIYQLIAFKENILVATSKGIYQISNVEAILKKMPAAIPFYITNISYYKGDTSNISSITLPYLNNRLTVNFDALCYNTPKELQHYYRLVTGEDTLWRSINSNQIILENLAPGSYQLQLKAAMPRQGRYSAVQTLHIIINKPWWQLNGVRAAALLFLLLLVYGFYQWRINAIKRREHEKTVIKTQLAELEQTALRSQMNPHFIFNCLSSIQQLVLAGEKEEANDYLVKFSRLIRKTLELSSNSYITLAQEKDYLSEYLVLEQLRMPGGFEFVFTIDHNIDIFKTEIPNMMLQPIVENCIRHGIRQLQNRKGKITIHIMLINNFVRCEVTDNGVGINKAVARKMLTHHKSYGIGIVRKRLTGLSNYNPDDCFVRVEDVINDGNIPFGTKVILQLPFKINTI
jgi:Histidine kinase/Two component regulator propeller